MSENVSNCCRHCGCIDPTDGIVTALRARVAELEGALLTPDETAAVRAFWEYGATRGNHPDGGGAGPGPLTGWINSMGDAVRKLTARALLPAPAPGRDTEGSGTTDGGTDAA